MEFTVQIILTPGVSRMSWSHRLSEVSPKKEPGVAGAKHIVGIIRDNQCAFALACHVYTRGKGGLALPALFFPTVFHKIDRKPKFLANPVRKAGLARARRTVENDVRRT